MNAKKNSLNNYNLKINHLSLQFLLKLKELLHFKFEVEIAAKKVSGQRSGHLLQLTTRVCVIPVPHSNAGLLTNQLGYLCEVGAFAE